VPVIAVGRIEPEQPRNEGIAAGHFDMVAMGRKLLADPELPNKLAANDPLSDPALHLLLRLRQPDLPEPRTSVAR
jgi:2,4-dienoyl-CoA reductase-like NADH-dependent reductase (Old Yellow Enzyme family)